MFRLDEALLNVTERLCQRFQAWTGWTNVWLAFQLTNLSVVLYFIWVIGLYRISGILEARIFIGCFCVAVFVIVTRTVFRTSIELAEAQAYRRVAKGLRNPRRLRDAQLRISFLTLSIVLAYPLWYASATLHSRFLLLTAALIVLTTIVLYVLACDPLPPGEARVRVWLRGFLPARGAALADPGN
jgi:hypothetical protein